MTKKSMDMLHERVEGGKSYKAMVVGLDDEKEVAADVDKDVIDEEIVDEAEMRVNEGLFGEYECPEFVFSKAEEKRIFMPWRRGVIVKLLGRRIGYKALENRLKQMWVRKGVINIIDLGNQYYLVAFTNEEDKNAAISDGPWFIYDHYLTVREWSPNFHPANDTIKNVAVWVRISGLPIEYYDSKVLHFIGNRVGKTVKVDKNTLQQERGKYARLCVEVNLTKPLLAMFSIKGRKYHIEYEGLHMLCITCGKFGHYREGCPNKVQVPEITHIEKQGTNVSSGGDKTGIPGEAAGPWVVVQKPKRNRKKKEEEEPATNNKRNAIAEKNTSESKLSGSRFISLSDDILEVNDVGKTSGISRKEADNIIEILKLDKDDNNIVGQDHKDNNEADNIVQIIDEPQDEGNEMQFDDNMVNNNSVQLKLDRPNIPRPPNIIPSPYPDNPLIGYKEGDSNFENEEFMDANDQSSNVSSEFEMEVVQETPAFS
ncbi:hypothetical protein TSUD_315330 [Trifolium subterraneum]|uniref:CCHC-type domain-containing protein n=1 Tax=Trifolium subterraneum TaxID=3900 RepID=A0A2Z6MNN8_TRISU|nr:hypothetical protein TSUD_315330 [Trifolium subterraneum]